MLQRLDEAGCALKLTFQTAIMRAVNPAVNFIVWHRPRSANVLGHHAGWSSWLGSCMQTRRQVLRAFNIY